MSAGRTLVETHTRLFNQGVRSGDFAPMLALFADDADLIFRGIPVGPFHGRAAIAAAYRTQPPDDEIVLLDVAETDGTLVATYAWRAAPTTPAGQMIITPTGDRIARLVVIYGMDAV